VAPVEQDAIGRREQGLVNICPQRKHARASEKKALTNVKFAQITDLTEVDAPKQQVEEADKEDRKAEEVKPTTPNKSNGELIVLDAAETNSGVDGLSLDDLNDDDFNPRAESSENDEEEDADDEGFDPRAPSAPVPAPAPSATTTAPPVIMAPPRAPARAAPAAPAPVVGHSEDIFARKMDPFGGNDPFGMDTFGSSGGGMVGSAFQAGITTAAANFSLDELDPLKK